MCSSRNQLLSQKEIVQFTLPRLHKGKHWYVDFFAYDPKRDAMRRKKYMLDRYKSARDREKFAAILIHNLSKAETRLEPLDNGQPDTPFHRIQ